MVSFNVAEVLNGVNLSTCRIEVLPAYLLMAGISILLLSGV